MENNEIIEQTAEVATTVAEQVKEPGAVKEFCDAVRSWVPVGAGTFLGASAVAGFGLGVGFLVTKAVPKLVTKLRNRKAKKEDRKKSKDNDDNVDVGEMPETIDE